MNDRTYYIEVKLRDNVSDIRFDAIRPMRPTIKEYKAFEKKLVSQHPVYSENAEQLIKYFVEYRDGAITPDRYNYFEPVNKAFDANSLEDPISCLAFPAGILYLKKNRGPVIVIKNETHAFVWKNDVYMAPVRELSEYLTTITVFFDKRKNTEMSFYVQLLKDIKEAFGANNGKIYSQATGEVIAE